MNFKAHATGAVFASIATTSFFVLEADLPIEYSWIPFLATTAGGLFPDLDTKSTPSKWVARIGFVSTFLMILIGVWQNLTELILLAAVMGCVFFLLKSFKHRGITHKYWIPGALIGLSFSLLYLTDFVPVIMSSVGLGIVVHLHLDTIWLWKIREGWYIKIFGA
ncbi:metal-dependent hydrolase [bacterium]|nr:metal-dependent hydrolase [bacterium]